MRLLLLSATYTFPAPSTPNPFGPENKATEPIPSKKPEVDTLPAKVETTPAGVIFLMAEELDSVTNTFSDASTAIEYGILNCATVAAPLLNPAIPEPAKVDTKPKGDTLRIQ